MIFVEVHLGSFEGSPKSLNGDIVGGSSFAIHADSDVLFLEDQLEVMAGELRTLVGIKNLRCSKLHQSSPECRDAKLGIHGLGYLP